MNKKIDILQIDAFAEKPFSGNPAAVAFGNELTADEMQLIAKEMNLSETAFISKSDKGDYNLRWFTPAIEVELCGHATIASLHFLNEQNLLKDGESVTFDTRSGILKCSFKDSRYFMQIPVFSLKKYDDYRNELLNALGIPDEEFDTSIPMILVENGYIYIHVKKLDTIKAIQPDYKKLLQLSRKSKEFGGIIVFTLETIEYNSFAHLRFFGPAYGIDEDPVTGSANGPLLLVLKELGFVKDEKANLSLTFEQGDFIGRQGRIGVHFDASSGELYISGNAVTVMKGELNF